MNELSMAILEQERNIIKNQIFYYNRRKELIEKFMIDFPNSTLEQTKCFISWVNHSELPYEDILDKSQIR